MIGLKLSKKVLNELLGKGVEFSEIFVQNRILNNLKLEDSKIESSSSGFELGCGLRIISGDSTYYAYVDSLSSDKILNAAKVLRSAVCSKLRKKTLDLSERKKPSEKAIDRHPFSVIQEDKKSFLLEVDFAARNHNPAIIQVTSNLSDLVENTYIANSEGFFCSDELVMVYLSVNAVARKGSEIRTGYKSIAKTKGYEIFFIKKPSDISIEASTIAVKMLDAENAPVGTMPVVLGPAFGGVIFHEACGHGLEADAVLKDASVYKGKIGKEIASPMVTAVDDATIPYHWGSYAFDDEGYPSEKNVLIENGILRSYIFDYKTAKKMKMKQTGNGRRQSFRDIPIPRMSNTYIENGSEDPSVIIKSVKSGVYAKEFAGGQVDPATGDFVFGISEGYIIENGNICAPIKNATLIGNGPEILKKIDAVGNDLDFAPGFCGKGGQSVSNEVGQPTILVSEITVGGTKVQENDNE
ncbi:MAG: TldD/PmbA family protein [Actinobacteria bacterium]|nr:TldD/PmbA family protein [Actinomycetota bacterium]MBM3713171.1 TldD/PmbA family protein [Actinomycetota bacterium]